MFRIRVKIDKKWSTHFETDDSVEAVAVYNSCGFYPKMFIGPKGIEHKQYTKNDFKWRR